MDDFNLTKTLGQVSSSEAGAIFRNFLRGGVRQMICEVMAEEVNELCGPKHHPNASGNVRAGSSTGRVIAHDQREDIVRPRVRHTNDQGNQNEVQLQTYQAAKDPTALADSIIQALASGVSTREMQNVKPGAQESASPTFRVIGKKLAVNSLTNFEDAILPANSGPLLEEV